MYRPDKNRPSITYSDGTFALEITQNGLGYDWKLLYEDHSFVITYGTSRDLDELAEETGKMVYEFCGSMEYLLPFINEDKTYG